MLKQHPKGLFVLALANMGERFGFYTMLAIFALYLQAKFGLDSSNTSLIYGTFIAFVYFMPLLGGILADKILGYGRTVLLGIVVMFIGYFLLAYPSNPDKIGYIMMFSALILITLGTGFFKGNLQALVGNLYDNPIYSSKRDIAFSIFYMGINIGAFLAPSAAEMVSNYFLAKDGFTYEAKIPKKAIAFLNYPVIDSSTFIIENSAVLKEKNIYAAINNLKNKKSVLFPSDKQKLAEELTVYGKLQQKDNFSNPETFAKQY